MATPPPRTVDRRPPRESGAVQRLRASLTSGPNLPARPHLLVACSAGKDSVTLAWLISALARAGAVSATMVHIDHRQRGDSATAAEVAREIAARLGMPFLLRSLAPAAISAHQGVGVEEAMRRERYLALAEACHDVRADAVALGHHQRDQAETVLLHLLRGSGLTGVTGMRTWSTLSVPWWDAIVPPTRLSLWRPLLGEPYMTVQALWQESGLPASEDPSNQARDLRRNALRHEALPLLERIFPGAAGTIARFAKLAGDDDALLTQLAVDAVGGNTGPLPREVVVRQPAPIARRIIRDWLRSEGICADLMANRLDAVLMMAVRNRSGAMVELGDGWLVQLDRGVLSVVSPGRGTIAVTDVAHPEGDTN